MDLGGSRPFVIPKIALRIRYRVVLVFSLSSPSRRFGLSSLTSRAGRKFEWKRGLADITTQSDEVLSGPISYWFPGRAFRAETTCAEGRIPGITLQRLPYRRLDRGSLQTAHLLTCITGQHPRVILSYPGVRFWLTGHDLAWKVSRFGLCLVGLSRLVRTA